MNGLRMCIADFDIVNPYFRTADNAELLRSLGVTALIPPYANTNVDIPSLPPAVSMLFDEDNYSVADVGGDGEGAAVLGVFKNKFIAAGYDMYYVYNMFRPENIDAETSYMSYKTIEASSGLKFGGIINNSNLGAETTITQVASSVSHAEEFASLTGTPLLMTTAFRQNAPDGAVIIEDITKKLF